MFLVGVDEEPRVYICDFRANFIHVFEFEAVDIIGDPTLRVDDGELMFVDATGGEVGMFFKNAFESV